MNTEAGVSTTQPYPAGRAARRVVRAALRAETIATAEQEAMLVGRSAKCRGELSPQPGVLPPRPWHRSEAGGCRNDGTTCVCHCHDETPVAIGGAQ